MWPSRAHHGGFHRHGNTRAQCLRFISASAVNFPVGPCDYDSVAVKDGCGDK